MIQVHCRQAFVSLAHRQGRILLPEEYVFKGGPRGFFLEQDPEATQVGDGPPHCKRPAILVGSASQCLKRPAGPFPLLLVAVNLRLRGIGNQDHDDVGPLRHIGHVADGEAGGLRLGARAAGRRQADADADAAILQIQRVRVPLRSVTDNPDILALDQREVRRVVVLHGRHS